MAGGVGGVPPQIQKRGRVAYISSLPTSGTQNVGKPKAHGGGQMGVQGGEAPMAGGVPRSRRLKSAPLKKGRPAPSTGVASLRPYIEPGVEGAQPPPRGFGGCAPKNSKEGASCPP
jgi:hypothetical protein